MLQTNTNTPALSHTSVWTTNWTSLWVVSSYTKQSNSKKKKINTNNIKINTSQSVVDVSEFDHGEPFKSVINSFLTVLALMMVFGAAAWQ